MRSCITDYIDKIDVVVRLVVVLFTTAWNNFIVYFFEWNFDAKSTLLNVSNRSWIKWEVNNTGKLNEHFLYLFLPFLTSPQLPLFRNK